MRAPAAESGAFNNHLDPYLQLYNDSDPSVMVQEGTAVSVPADGDTYYIRVMAADVRESGKTAFGEYILIDPPTAEPGFATVNQSGVALLAPGPIQVGKSMAVPLKQDSDRSLEFADEPSLLIDFSPKVSNPRPVDVDALMRGFGRERNERGFDDGSESEHVCLVEDDPLQAALLFS